MNAGEGTRMTRRDQVRAIVRGELPGRVPTFLECPMDATVYRDFGIAPTGDPAADAIAEAELFENLAVSVALVPGMETLERDGSHHLYRYETGAVWREQYVPTFCREALRFPVNAPEEARAFRMPPVKARDAALARERVARLNAEGYYVEGAVPGCWQGSYYYIARFETLLEWLLEEPEAAKAVIDACAAYSLEAARVLLEAGADGIIAASDLGTGTSLIMSPRLIRAYVVPWMARMAALCHRYGALFHLHSHGHIEGIMDDIVAAGVDILNPVGPSDNNDLAMFKRRWGGRITLQGGISSKIADMDEGAMCAHVFDVVNTGRIGGRFFPRSESGVPPMSAGRLTAYLGALREAGAAGYAPRAQDERMADP
jgi:hypothetical protein